MSHHTAGCRRRLALRAHDRAHGGMGDSQVVSQSDQGLLSPHASKDRNDIQQLYRLEALTETVGRETFESWRMRSSVP